MSADIEKMSVFDARIVQGQPQYAVDKGALSVTNAPFNAIAANAAQMTFNVLVPSENVFIDRALDWSSTCYLQFDVSFNAVAGGPGIAGGVPTVPGATGQEKAIKVLGRDLALAPFPLHQACTTLTATINDTTVTLNASDVLNQILRLTDMKQNRYQRTCPTMMDNYQNYDDAFGAVNSPLAGWSEAKNVDEVPNGAYWRVEFCDDAGNSLLQPGAANAQVNGPAVGAGYAQWCYDPAVGIPFPLNAIAQGDTNKFRLYLKFTSTEKLVLSPFVFADSHEWDTGLFGCQNIQFVMNFQQPSRLLRDSGGAGARIVDSTVQFLNVQGSPWSSPRLNVQFLTPSLDVSLPPKSVVPYMEFPRFISAQYAPLAPFGQPNSTATLVSQTITLPQIPDMLIIYVKPSTYSPPQTGAGASPLQTNQVADWMLGINQISVNFDNFAGLLSSHSQEQLYKMSVHNGVQMDYDSWTGVQNTNNNGFQRSRRPAVGSMLILKPGRDITLQAGQASGLVGNFVLQFNLGVYNLADYAVTPQIYVITANSGYFETIKGSSRVIKGVLTEQDIISAPIAPMGTAKKLERMVGAGFLDKLSNAIGKVSDLYHATKGHVSTAKEMLHRTGHPTAQKVAKVLGQVGYGATGAASTGGRRKAHPLADRLME